MGEAVAKKKIDKYLSVGCKVYFVFEDRSICLAFVAKDNEDAFKKAEQKTEDLNSPKAY